MTSRVQVEPAHYQHAGYDTLARFASYWHQIDEVRRLEPESVLEVGVGNGFVADYLRKRGLAVTTLDIDGRLRPDVVGTLHALPFKGGAFEVVACFEVLEHLPYEELPRGLAELARVARRSIVLSIPDGSDAGWVDLRLGAFRRVRSFRRLFTLPRLRPRATPRTPGEHHWEINIRGYPLRRVVADLERGTGFELVRAYRSFQNPYHRFFVLRRPSARDGRRGGAAVLTADSPRAGGRRA